MAGNNEAPKLDLTKPVQCRSGDEVRILCTDGPEDAPIVGIVRGEVAQWEFSGSWCGVKNNDMDLVNAPEKRTLWVYECDDEFVPATFLKIRDERSETLDNDCLSRIRVEFETGRKDE